MRWRIAVAIRGMVKAPRWQIVAALGVIYVIWGSTYVGQRVIAQTTPPLLTSSVRFLLAGAILGAVVAARSRSTYPMTTKQFLGAGALGLLLLPGANGLMVLGSMTVPAGMAALLGSAMPLWIVVMRSLCGDRPVFLTSVGAGIGILGIGLLVQSGGGHRGAALNGILLISVSTILWSFGSFVTPLMDTPRDPLLASTVQMIAGGVGMAVFGMARGELTALNVHNIPAQGWWAMVYLSIFGSVLAYSCYLWLLNRVSISLVSTFAYVNPVVAVGLGAILLNEPFTPLMAAGGLTTVGAVALVLWSERKSLPVPDEGAVLSGFVAPTDSMKPHSGVIRP